MNKYLQLAAMAALVTVTGTSAYFLVKDNPVVEPEPSQVVAVEDPSADTVTENVKTDSETTKTLKADEPTSAATPVKTVSTPLVTTPCAGTVTAQVKDDKGFVYLNGKQVASQQLSDNLIKAMATGEGVEAQVEDKVGCVALVSYTSSGKGGAIYYWNMDMLQVVDLASGKSWYSTELPAQDISPNGQQLTGTAVISIGGVPAYNVTVLDATDGNVVHAYPVPYEEISLPVWSPDGKQVAFAGVYKFTEFKNEVVIMDVATGKFTVYQSAADEILNVTAWSGKYPTVASVGIVN